MVNFVIIDDNIMHRKRVYNIICTYMMDNNVDFKIYEFNDIDDNTTISEILYIAYDLVSFKYII